MMDGCTRSMLSKNTRSILSRLFETVVEPSVYWPRVDMVKQISAPCCRASLIPSVNDRVFTA
jgi:hypothetical protein